MSFYEKHVMQNPALPFIFHSNIRHVPTRLYQSDNWHENIEILYFKHGEGTARVNAQGYSVREGDVVVINSNCLHDFITNSCLEYYCLIIDRSFCVSNFFDIDNIHFKTHFRGDEFKERFDELSSCFSKENDSPWRVHTIRLLVLSILTDIIKLHSEEYDRTLDSDKKLISCVKHAIGFIRSECCLRDITLDELSSHVGLSKYYFAREFKRITGHTVVNYINLTRCEFAKSLLCESEESIAEIARKCAFSDQSYFTRVFRMVSGISPSKYRKTNLKTSPDEAMAMRLNKTSK